MKKQTTFRKTIEKVWKNRAAIVIAIAATVFMCGLTALEFVALRMEWNLPVLAYVTGDSDSYIFEEYRSDEMKLDESTENVMLEEDMLQGESQSENSEKDITQGESQSEDDIVPGEGKNENVRQEDTVQGENQQEKDHCYRLMQYIYPQCISACKRKRSAMGLVKECRHFVFNGILTGICTCQEYEKPRHERKIIH